MNKRIIEPAEKIQSAALSLFIENGIAGTTTKEIARKAGVSEGSIYNHFKSKGDLAYKLFVRYMDQFREELEARSSAAVGPAEKLTAAVGAFFGFAAREPEAYAYIMVGHYTELAKMPPSKKKPKDVFTAIINEGIKSGAFMKMNKDLGAAYVIGMVTRAILFYKNGLLDMPYERLIKDTAASCLTVLGHGRRKPL